MTCRAKSIIVEEMLKILKFANQGSFRVFKLKAEIV